MMKERKILVLVILILLVPFFGCKKIIDDSYDNAEKVMSTKAILENNRIKKGEDVLIKLYFGVQSGFKLRSKEGVPADRYTAEIKIEYGKYEEYYITDYNSSCSKKKKTSIHTKISEYIYKTIEDFCLSDYPSIYYGIDENSKYEEIIIPSYKFTESMGYFYIHIDIYGVYDDIVSDESRGIVTRLYYKIENDEIIIN